MKIPSALLVIGLVFASSGCVAIQNHKLAPHRTKLMTIYQDKIRPVSERVEAFDLLVETFSKGTSERTIDRFAGSVAVTKSRIDGPPDGDVENWVWTPGGTYCLRLVAPDGSERWITLHDDRVAD